MTAPTGPTRRPGVNPFEEVLFEVKRTIVGQDNLLERMAVALLTGGHLLVEGCPGGQDAGGADARRRDRRPGSSEIQFARPWFPPT